MSASLSVDGGAIFQILAIENLGLRATAIGIAFGLGVCRCGGYVSDGALGRSRPV